MADFRLTKFGGEFGAPYFFSVDFRRIIFGGEFGDFLAAEGSTHDPTPIPP